MKDIEKKDRMSKLKEKVHQLNRWIDKKIRNYDFPSEPSLHYKTMYQGLIFPIQTGDDEDPIIILDLVAERGRVFNTKTRAPVMVCLETIKFSEAQENIEILFEASKRIQKEHAQRENMEAEIDDSTMSPERKIINDNIKVNADDFIEEDTELPNVNHKALVNNPFTGNEDDELHEEEEGQK